MTVSHEDRHHPVTASALQIALPRQAFHGVGVMVIASSWAMTAASCVGGTRTQASHRRADDRTRQNCGEHRRQHGRSLHRLGQWGCDVLLWGADDGNRTRVFSLESFFGGRTPLRIAAGHTALSKPKYHV